MSYDMPKSYTWQCIVIFSALLFSSQLLSVQSQQGKVLHTSCQNLTVTSRYEVNLNALISSLSSLPHSENGFYNVSVGETDDENVNSLMLCRGDVKPIDCISCIVRAGQEIRGRCPNEKEAVIWYDHCMFRYSNRTILNTMDTSTGFILFSDYDFPGDKGAWDTMLTNLLEGLRSKAAAGGEKKKFAVSKMSGPSLQTVYGLMQCTPEISEHDCIDCLTWSISRIPIRCNSKIGCRHASVSCNLRYDTSRFYALTAEEPTRALPPTHLPPINETASDGKGFVIDGVKGVVFIIVVIVGCVVFLIISCVVIFLILRKKQNRKKEVMESLKIEFSAIRIATNNFSPKNELGQGGFGKVYKGVLNGKEVAVKRLSENVTQGEIQFGNEVKSMATLSHRNLVKLVGFSVEKNERAIIYEFLPNKSLDNVIFDNALEWETRYKIIEGVARGMIYLHEECHEPHIIHRDLKPGNVLLDKDMTPKIADFGLAKIFDESQISKQFTSNIMGTEGYIAPEFRHEGQSSFKTDVYSYGVLVLEILSGKSIWKSKMGENEEDLITYAKKMYKENKPLKPEDSNLGRRDKEDILTCISIGLRCVEYNPSDRPKIMHVGQMLEKTNRSHAVSEQRSVKGRKSRVHV